MTNKELQQQAKEYGMTVSEIKEYRKHLIPYLEYAIKRIELYPSNMNFLCCMADDKLGYNISKYIKLRILHTRPSDSGDGKAWYSEELDNRTLSCVEVNKIKLQWCRQQLKIVKP